MVGAHGKLLLLGQHPGSLATTLGCLCVFGVGMIARLGRCVFNWLAMTTTAPTKKIKLSDVPVATGVDLVALKGSDADNVLEVLAVFEPTTEADTRVLKALLAKAVDGKLSGSRGHLTKEEAGHKFPDVALHWIGAIELDDGRIAFRGVVDEAQRDLMRWIKAKQISFEPWSNGYVVALDAMSAHRATRGTPAMLGTEDDAGAGGDIQATDTKANDNAEGEMANSSALGLEVVRRSIVPANQRDGVYVRPIGFEENTDDRSQGNTSNPVMAGLTVRRRSL